MMDTLFDIMLWHAFAKSCMHTDSSLQIFEAITKSLGHQLRSFAKNVCPKFKTRETLGEMATWVWCNVNVVKKSGPSSAVQTDPMAVSTSLQKSSNLSISSHISSMHWGTMSRLFHHLECPILIVLKL